MNDTLVRHWRMLREIPRFPRKISAPELKETLERAGYETTLRTIQRDLNKLSAALPLLSDDAKPQGWSWEADAAQLDLPTLEPQAALVFHLVERYLQPMLPASTMGYLAPWFRTANGVLDLHGNGLSGWRNKIRVLSPGQPLQPPTVDSDVQSVVTQALLLDRRVLVTYRPRGAKNDKEYVVSPLGLVVRDQVIYLVCTLRDYPDVKQLVFNRMRAAVLMEEAVNRSVDFDLDRYIKQGEFGWPVESGERINLIADFTRSAAINIIEQPLDRHQQIEEIDAGTIRLSASVIDTYELRRWLRTYGDQVEVLAPEALRNEIAQGAVSLMERYAKKGLNKPTTGHPVGEFKVMQSSKTPGNKVLQLTADVPDHVAERLKMGISELLERLAGTTRNI